MPFRQISAVIISPSRLPPQLRKRPAALQQRSRLPLLKHKAVAHDDDGVGVAQGAEAMREDKAGSPRHEQTHRLLRPCFRQRIDRARGLIENQYPRIGNQSTGEADELPLSE